ncbi:DUF805 domain-containing protein [Parerythrobacter aestuarii]|uniref:DUF805 domain-containing protein n=1 Tax=Parerythrobacter aestuarii TaxID=3020909 RepID=UPI0024DE8D1A|nr:DUF805 domain-containing protein [Parerythrobacter aestuarii]
MNDATGDDSRYQSGLVRDLWLLPQTVRNSFTFEGRSRRTEMVVYLIVGSILLQLVVGLIDLTGLIEEDAIGWGSAITFFIPLPALLTRRLHDMGRTGWLTLPVIALMLVATYEDWLVSTMDTSDPAWPDPWGLTGDMISLAGALCVVAILLLPEKNENNPYGRDPRLD